MSQSIHSFLHRITSHHIASHRILNPFFSLSFSLSFFLLHSLTHSHFIFIFIFIFNFTMTTAFATPCLARPRTNTTSIAASRSRMCAVREEAVPSSDRNRNQTVSDWRTFRAHLIASRRLNQPPHLHLPSTSSSSSTSWTHVLPRVEVGSCLVSSPSHSWPAAFAHLRRAVVLVTRVGPSGVSGLLLNRPTRYTVGAHASVLARAGPEFTDNRVFLGGDCSTGTLDVLHTHEELQGATRIIPGVASGGLNAARQCVRDGKADARDFQLYVAYAKWTTSAFDAEMQSGAWNVVACAPSVLFQRNGSGCEKENGNEVEERDLWAQLHSCIVKSTQA